MSFRIVDNTKNSNQSKLPIDAKETFARYQELINSNAQKKDQSTTNTTPLPVKPQTNSQVGSVHGSFVVVPGNTEDMY